MARLSWCDDHYDLATFKLRFLLNFGNGFEVGFHAVEESLADIHVGHFTTTEPQGHLHFVAIFKEPFHIAHLHILVVNIDVRSQFDLFDLDDLLLLPRLVLLFLFLVLVFTVVEDLCDGRVGVGRNFYEIKPRFISFAEGGVAVHDPDVVPIGADQAYRGVVDLLVDAGSILGGRRLLVESSYVSISCFC